VTFDPGRNILSADTPILEGDTVTEENTFETAQQQRWSFCALQV